ncbi:MAG: type II toxin-antitoxin system Phd/YefM family antitoxin [Candidatus Binataceae bacterium]
MSRIINTKELRAKLPEIVKRARRGERFVVLYRSRPAFQLGPVEEYLALDRTPAEEDSLFAAGPVGRSRDGLRSAEHDKILYGVRR